MVLSGREHRDFLRIISFSHTWKLISRSVKHIERKRSILKKLDKLDIYYFISIRTDVISCHWVSLIIQERSIECVLR